MQVAATDEMTGESTCHDTRLFTGLRRSHHVSCCSRARAGVHGSLEPVEENWGRDFATTENGFKFNGA